MLPCQTMSFQRVITRHSFFNESLNKCKESEWLDSALVITSSSLAVALWWVSCSQHWPSSVQSLSCAAALLRVAAAERMIEWSSLWQVGRMRGHFKHKLDIVKLEPSIFKLQNKLWVCAWILVFWCKRAYKGCFCLMSFWVTWKLVNLHYCDWLPGA